MREEDEMERRSEVFELLEVLARSGRGGRGGGGEEGFGRVVVGAAVEEDVGVVDCQEVGRGRWVGPRERRERDPTRYGHQCVSL
jgi:hypothetical protein